METRFNRRRLLAGAVAGAGTYALLGGPAILTSRGQVASGGKFTQGIASGEPAPNGITLWTRIEDLGGGDRVRYEIADNEEFQNARDDTVEVASGNPIVKPRVQGLDPDTQYYFRFSTNGEDSPVGRTKTTPEKNSNTPVSVAFFSCQEYVSGFYHVHRDLAELDETIDLVVCLGDYIYEQTFDDSGLPERADPTGEVFTVDEYRAKYDFYQTDQDLLAMRAKHPLTAIWDDHEVEDNYAQMLPGGAATKRPATFRSRQSAGYKVFFEYIPRYPVGGDSTRIYNSIPLGNAEVFLTDSRQYRDNQVCAPGDSFVSLPGCPPTELNKLGRTLLGKDQLDWLKSGLDNSKAKWKIVGNQVMIMSLDVPTPRNALNSDSWDGYGDERRELIEFIDEQDIENVSFITGDIHTFFAGVVTSSGRLDSVIGTPSTPDEGVIIGDGPRATEFVGGSVTSKGILDRANDNEDIRDVPDVGAEIETTVNNPHIMFSDQAFKGYGILTAGDDLQVEYRAVCDVSSETNKTVERLALFTVAGDQKSPTVTVERNLLVCKTDGAGSGQPPTPPDGVQP